MLKLLYTVAIGGFVWEMVVAPTRINWLRTQRGMLESQIAGHEKLRLELLTRDDPQSAQGQRARAYLNRGSQFDRDAVWYDGKMVSLSAAERESFELLTRLHWWRGHSFIAMGIDHLIGRS